MNGVAVSLKKEHPQGDGRNATIGDVLRDLGQLNRSTECDFLEVGSHLMDVRSTARQLSSDMAALTELVSGEESRNTSAALGRILEYSKQLGVRLEEGIDSLSRVSDFSREVKLNCSKLHGRISLFRSLCTQTRIEASRLARTGADCNELAVEVGPLSENIQVSGEGVVESSLKLDQFVQAALSVTSELTGRQLNELPTLISSVIAGLKTFEEGQLKASECSVLQAAQYEAICSNVEDVVRSVQFHDITRQQVEHVMQALQQVREEYGTELAKGDEVAPEARIIAALQASQLAGASKVFAGSVGRMGTDLDSISNRARSMSSVVQSLVDTSANSGESFFLHMEKQFSAILTMLKSCAKAQAEMESTASVLEGFVSTMRKSAGDIYSVVNHIKLTSMNATIQALAIGAEGNTLRVIAKVMHGLAIESAANTEALARALEAMGEAARHVSVNADKADSKAGARTEEIMDEMRRTIVDLHTSSESSFSRVNQVVNSSTQLAENLDSIRAGFRAGALFAEVSGRCCRALESMGADTGDGSAPNAVSSEQLDRLLTRYTMKAERDVHDSMAARVAVKPITAEISAGPATDGDFGDNVELF